MKRWLPWLPLILFVAVLAVAWSGLLSPQDKVIRSAMVGKPLPEFALRPLVPGKPGLSTADFRKGQPRLLNVFASWCLPCVVEAPQLMALHRAGYAVDAVAIRDTTPALQAFLARNGDPYAAIGDDPRSAVQLALGSSGVPETFVIDGKGVIVAQHIGEIREDDLPELIAALEKAK